MAKKNRWSGVGDDELHELRAAYDVLRDALFIAYKVTTLQSAAISGDDVSEFWRALHTLDDVYDGGLLSWLESSQTTPLEPINTTRDELQSLWCERLAAMSKEAADVAHLAGVRG